MDKEKALEDLKGSFAYGWLFAGFADVVIGMLGTFGFLQGADLNDGRIKITLVVIGIVCSMIAFFCGSRFRANRNQEQLVNVMQAQVDTFKAAAEKTERDSATEIAHLNELHQHEVQTMTAAREHEIHELKSEHRANLSEAKANYAISLSEKDAEIGRLTTMLEAEKLRTKEDVYEALCEVLDVYASQQQVESLTLNDVRDIVQSATDKLVSVEGETLCIGDTVIGTAPDDKTKELFDETEVPRT